VRINVDLGERSYDVVIRDGARHELATLLDQRASAAKDVAIVTSSSLQNQPWFDIDSGRSQSVLVVPEGEGAKNLVALEHLLDELAARRLSRDDVVVAVGGGAITDLVGFAAAVYLRGVAVVHVPTSLVGQVDAAIGGKTGVNLNAGKNLVGAFHQPLGVLCDTSTLRSLPERERSSGLGEIAKCWLLEGRGPHDIARTSQDDLIGLAVGLKAAVVANDEREGGMRALLNYGHTLGHALEKLALSRNADELRHGEAVAIGLAFAARLAVELGRTDVDTIDTHDAVLDAFGLAYRLPATYEVGDLIAVMSQDKKAHHDLSFVLAGPEGFSLVSDVDPGVVRRVLERFQGEQ
jgi:5-deoxy-5-amino-3-dehydroquinate synthase